ncbi:hypothetical protein SHLO109777_06960 [Shewanella loihica]|uniref:ENT domain-containing protein n=1 Tax=Shewanella loihica (strain ATCC BAA-1088 / PV-4) TaxID=323850 RepID=A3QHE4_SHELP|nr:hypothetical protein [Shewanella loihica]ABO24892.1 conserved hypothetical protein [Shewanella loihica PV-4]
MQEINTFIKENIGSVSKNVFVAPGIPEKKLNNAAKSMGLTDRVNTIIAIYDNTLFGSAKDGLAFTGEHLVFKPMFDDPMIFPYSDIEKVDYVEYVSTNDKGKEKKEVVVELLRKDGSRNTIDGLIDCDYRLLAEILNRAVTECDSFEEENQIVTLAEMSEALKVAYVKVIANMAFADDGEVDKKEFSEILMLMTRLELTTESRFELRSYLSSEHNQVPLVDLLATIDAECVPSHNKAVKISLVKDLISTYMSVNDGSYENFAFLDEHQALFGVSDDEVELALMAIKNDFNMLREDFTDDALKRGMKELSAKAGAVGVPLAAVYLSGSVVGLSAAGMTSGLAALGLGGALGFSSMATGIGVAVLLGVGAYKGIKHFTGANELDKTKRRELMLNEVIKQTQATLSLLISDLNYITDKFNQAVASYGIQDAKVQKLMKMMTSLTGAADVLSRKSGVMQNSCIKLRCPIKLDEAKLKSLTQEPLKKQFYALVMGYYQEVEEEVQQGDESVNVTVLKIKPDISTRELDKLAAVFDAIGYFKAADVIKGKLSGIFS